MDLEGDTSNADDYLVTAVQIFEYCNADSNGTLRVEALMEKIAPFVKTSKSESELRSLLDPDYTNPEINVRMLSDVLSKYSDCQKNKVNFEDSFNLKSGPVPQDSDSGISSDGCHLVEELQCEVRARSREVAQLRGELLARELAHEEALAAAGAERAALRAHVSLLREENSVLSGLRRELEEAGERLAAAEAAGGAAEAALEAERRAGRQERRRLQALEAENQTLQELLDNSKEECHRMNDMYGRRQAALLAAGEARGAAAADLAAQLEQRGAALRELQHDKMRLELELSALRRARPEPDVSAGEDQLLAALSQLADSTAPYDGTLDDVSFLTLPAPRTPRTPRARPRMSLFDELRQSFNLSSVSDRCSTTDIYDDLDESITDFGLKETERELAKKQFGLERKYVDNCTQWENNDFHNEFKAIELRDEATQVESDTRLEMKDCYQKNIDKSSRDVETQCGVCCNNKNTQCEPTDVGLVTAATQCDMTEFGVQSSRQYNDAQTQCEVALHYTETHRPKHLRVKNCETQCGPKDFGTNNWQTQCAPKDFGIKHFESQCRPIDFGVKNFETQCSPADFGVQNFETQCSPADFGVQNFETQCSPADFGVQNFETQCSTADFGVKNFETQCSPADFGVQNFETQCSPADFGVQNFETQCSTADFGVKNFETQCSPADFGVKNCETQCNFKDFRASKSETQSGTDEDIVVHSIQTQCDQDFELNNNNGETPCKECEPCLTCEGLKQYATKLESEATRSRQLIKDLQINMDSYDHNLKLVQALSDEESRSNKVLKRSIKGLKEKLEVLERACAEQRARLAGWRPRPGSRTETRSVGAQAEAPCPQCAARAPPAAPRSWRQWLSARAPRLLPFLAALCLLGALLLLQHVSRHHSSSRRCAPPAPAAPWSWLRAGDVLDAVFHVEYVGEVPM